MSSLSYLYQFWTSLSWLLLYFEILNCFHIIVTLSFVNIYASSRRIRANQAELWVCDPDSPSENFENKAPCQNKNNTPLALINTSQPGLTCGPGPGQKLPKTKKTTNTSLQNHKTKTRSKYILTHIHSIYKPRTSKNKRPRNPEKSTQNRISKPNPTKT